MTPINSFLCGPLNGYVLFEVIIIQSFPHLWFITGFVTRVTRQVSHVEQDLLTSPEHLNSPQVFSGLVLINLTFSVYCFVDHCLSFDLWLLIIPLVSYFLLLANVISGAGTAYLSRFCFTCLNGVRVVHVVKSHVVLWCLLPFPCKNDDQFFVTPICVVGGSRFIYVICNKYWCPTLFPNQMMFASFNSNTKGVTIGAGTSNQISSPIFSGVSVAQSVVFCLMFCRSLFVLLSFFFWPLHCLLFIGIPAHSIQTSNLNWQY